MVDAASLFALIP